jgi:hypothetical protein
MTSTMQTLPPSLRLSAGSPTAPATSGLSGGTPLTPEVGGPLQRSLQVDLSGVRVFSNATAQKTAQALSTRAVTFGNQILLGSGERPTDMRVMAHEAAHVVQQRGAPTLQSFNSEPGDAYEHEAEQASAAVLRGEQFIVRERAAFARLQGLLGIDLPNPLNWLADKANVIPGFRMFTIVLGVNPINMSPVARSAANILRALIEFMPGGGLITQALDNSGVFEKAGAFVETQIASLGLVGSSIKAAVTAFISGLSLTRIVTDPGGVWESAKRIFTDPIDRIISFAKGLVSGIIELIKDAILKPIAKLAEGTEGYNLLKGILGKDPITGDPVPRSAETLLGPLLKMIGLGDVWEKMQQANAIPRCWAWFQSTMAGLIAIVSQIPPSFIAAFKSLTLEDIILVPKAFIKLGKVFVGFVEKFVTWGVTAMWNLLEIVFDVVSPGAFGYIKKTGAALKSILKNPLPFVGNLAKAAMAGFKNFGSNFLTHLKNGLIDWLTGSLTGIYIPKALTLLEFGKMALSVLGLSWAQIRGKIVKALGPSGETIMKGLEAAFDVIKALVTGGPAAAWEVLKDKLTTLKDTIVSGITDMVIEAVVTKGIPKLIAMFIPGAGFISAIISIYDMIMVFVQKIAQIIAVVTAFIDSIVAIAAGNIGAAAGKVESILARLLALAINFIAGFAGLGKIASKVRGIVEKVRTAVDKGLDAAIAFIINKAKSLFGALFGKKKDKAAPAPAGAQEPGHMEPIVVPFQMAGSGHTFTIREGPGGVEFLVASTPLPLTTTFQRLYAEIDDWRHFLEGIRAKLPPAVQKQVDAKINHLKNIRQTQVEGYKEIYERTFGSRRGGPGHSDPNREREAVRQLTQRAMADVAKIAAWAVDTKVPELSPAAVKSSIRTIATESFNQAVEQRRQAVDGILSKFKTPSGAAVQYRGSLAEGKKGPHKGDVRFNPDDFDLDLFVVDPVLHADALTRQPRLRADFTGKPLPAAIAGGAAASLQRAAVAALQAPGAVPGLRLGANYILIKLR